MVWFSPEWTLWCCLRLLLCEKDLLKWLHLYGLCPVWILICLRRSPFNVKVLPQCLHWCGFSPVWIIWCLSRCFFLSEQFATLIALRKLFSLWVKRCDKRILFSVKDLSHWLHWYGFSPVCALKCFVRWCFKCESFYYVFCIDVDSPNMHTPMFCKDIFTEKSLSHWLHWYGFYPVIALIFFQYHSYMK